VAVKGPSATISAMGLGRVKTHLQERRDSDLPWFGKWVGIFAELCAFLAPNHPGPASRRPFTLGESAD
jgi:hypothetical protein